MKNLMTNHGLLGFGLLLCSLCWCMISVPVWGQSVVPLKEWKTLCSRMVERNIVAAGVKDPRVLDSIRSTPRHEFVPIEQRSRAYFDMALPIGFDQTISSPFIVAYMTECLAPSQADRVLEIGTGSGYQAAVLSPLVRDVYTIEIVPQLGRRAATVLRRLGYKNVHCRVGDGYQGWPDAAPFDKIIVTCSPEKVPVKLVEQLKEGGRVIIPLGERYRQTFYLLRKVNGQLEFEALRPTMFVPMTGEAERRREVLPDGANPTLFNGDFEIAVEDKDIIDGWYYQRQLRWIADTAAPKGEHYIQLSNRTPGLPAGTQQGFGLDGREVKRLKIICQVKADSVFAEPRSGRLPAIEMVFFDERHNEQAVRRSSLWKGTFDWRQDVNYFDVPPQTRYAVINFLMYGATGTVSIDDVQMDFR